MTKEEAIIVDTSDVAAKSGGSPVQKRLEARTKGEGMTMEEIEKSLTEAEARRAEHEELIKEKAKGNKEQVQKNIEEMHAREQLETEQRRTDLEAALADAEKRRLAFEEAKKEKAKGNKDAVSRNQEEMNAQTAKLKADLDKAYAEAEHRRNEYIMSLRLERERYHDKIRQYTEQAKHKEKEAAERGKAVIEEELSKAEEKRKAYLDAVVADAAKVSAKAMEVAAQQKEAEERRQKEAREKLESKLHAAAERREEQK